MRILLVALMAVLSLSVQAQELGRIEGRQATSGGYYLNALPGEPTTRLSVWGYVARPGVYDVGPDFDLTTVLSLAGGPSLLLSDEANLELVLSVFRDAVEIYSAPVDQVALGRGSLPRIQDGDIVELLPDRSVRVNVWGAVNGPGLKLVGPTDTIRSTISQAGGPTLGSLRGKGRREITLRVTRSATGDMLYDGLLFELPASINETPLADGDVLEIEVRELNGWEFRDTLTVVGAALSAVVAVTQIIRVFE